MSEVIRTAEEIEHEEADPVTTHTEIEIASQPACWLRGAEMAATAALPRPGERVAVVGCGTSWFIAQAYAVLRERAGHGETDAFAASEAPLAPGSSARTRASGFSGRTRTPDPSLGIRTSDSSGGIRTSDPSGGTRTSAPSTGRAGNGPAAGRAPVHATAGRAYDRVLALTRSGTTTEVLDLLRRLDGTATTVVTADPRTPVMALADEVVVLDFADERSVVQTRFATTQLALLRAHLGEDLTQAVADAERAIAEPVADALVAAEQFTFLGRGWTYGLAQEAALKMREASRSWTEAYPAMEYRHGPISIAGPGRVTWMLGPAPEGLAEDVRETGGAFVSRDTDPMAELVRIQRVAVARAQALGLDPDQPLHLSRSVILSS
ncbi:SIS domain-containing protein [Sphaerisporangium dianthi]|uniref:SIS domain-containing protein n=1 Tax=Sphaerisporangium dianthi TaxID=1436120 RepID=A0ABV9CPW1_9ACTN